MNFRKGKFSDIEQLKELAILSWNQYQEQLTEKNWQELYKSLNDLQTYVEMLEKSDCLICETVEGEVIGMAFLIPSGNPTEIYDEQWCQLRFVSVHPAHRGKGIGQHLTEKCITIARTNQEAIVALHTAEIMNTARHIYKKMGFKVLKEIPERFGLKYWLYTLNLEE